MWGLTGKSLRSTRPREEGHSGALKRGLVGNGSDGVVNRSRLIHPVMKHGGSRITMGLGVSGDLEGFTVVAAL